MSITIGKHQFEGPYTNTSELGNRSGVYAILCVNEGKYSMIDVGESSEVRSRVENHDREDCWHRNCSGTLAIAAYYTPNQQQSGRMVIEQEIRRQYKPPCGKA